MDSVIATGKIGEELITVIVTKEKDKFSITFNGKEDNKQRLMLEMMIDALPPTGGTYYPTKNDLFAYHSVLETMFFTELINIIVEGELDTMPYEDDPNTIY